MRVIDQARLWFREGNSDKVYEVDLVEVAPNQYVVNFRFGRRGTALRDGTKTATPVDLKKAQAVFSKLVAEKVAGGYKATDAASAAATNTATTPIPRVTDLVAQLHLGARAKVALGPVVWRVTDLDLVDAEPALLELLDAPNPDRRRVEDVPWRHALVSALVRCGTAAALPRLEKIITDAKAPPHVRDVARLAIARIAPARVTELARPLLGPGIVAAVERGDANAVARAAEETLVTDPVAARNVAVGLYLLDSAVTRPAVLAIVRVARLSNAEAACVRALFRLAELRRDGAVYAACARRIDGHTSPAPPMGPKTRQYLRRRVARMLRRLGRVASADYTAMATELLLTYADDDADQPRRGGWGNWYDSWARHHVLDDILYGRSPRYVRGHHRRATWKCARDYRPGGAIPAERREERFPEVWDAAPAALWRLIGAARATPVVEFAIKALRPNRAYTAQLSDEAVAEALASGHRVAQRFAFELALARPVSVVLARGALASDVADAHAWVLRWVESHVDDVAKQPELVALLVTGKTRAIRDAAIAVLRARTLEPAAQRSIATRAIATLMGLGADAAERATGAVAVILLALAEPLQDVDEAVLRDLIAHPLAALGELAGELMLRHVRRDRLPADLIQALLASPHASVRTLGGRLLAMTPADVAKDDVAALLLFATSPNAELRAATRTLIGEVAQRYPEVGRALADRLIDALLVAQPEGAPSHIVSLLRGELAGCLPVKPAPVVMRLIGALSPHAREAGGLLLGVVSADDLGLDDIARLAHHEIASVRHGAWTLARAALARYRVTPVAVARLVDSPWEDTRAFAIGFVRDELGAISADAIIAICDSIRPEVQALGRQLLQERFDTADAGRYVIRLAEHPATNLQLLVSGMLEHHVAGNLDRLRALVPYLIVVLSQVNRGRVAKQRVLGLLRREASRSAEAAALIAPILDRQSATSAVTQKHPLIATMVDVRVAFPEIALPIAVTPPAAHPGRG
jgi:hypothetical protein